MRLAQLLSLAAATAAASPTSCFVAINDVTAVLAFAEVIERPCFTTLYATDSPFAVSIRAYPRDAAMLVESSISDDPGRSFNENLQDTSYFLFQYFSGDNAKKANLSSALTAPLILRPVSPERSGDLSWVAAMALAPSRWPAGSTPPAPTLSNVAVRPFGEVVIASVPVLLPAAPVEEDFRVAYGLLESLVGFVPAGSGQWVLNNTSPLSPSFSYYFNEAYNGTGYLIEASAEVYFQQA